MGMITRYKKPGGFKQLLKLMETSGKSKQEKFLAIIKEEEPQWAEAIEKKMLTLERIMTWGDSVLVEIFPRLNDLTLAICSHLLPEEQWQAATKTFSHSKLRNIKDLFDGKTPSIAEQSTAVVNILTEVRSMIDDGFLRLEQIDSQLIIDDKTEEDLLNSGTATPKVAKEMDVDTSDVDRKLKMAGSEGLEEIKLEIVKLRKKVVILGTENHNLRKENEDLRKKIAQIKKLAA